jgi:peptidoglycan/LPS O-acetylase OafA/YrhL
MNPAPVVVSLSGRAVTTTDLLKTIALLFVAIDHVGYYFIDDAEWWRVFGRIAAPIFFFLIGFARSRSVPWTWLALGGLITVLDVAGSDDPLDARLNILLNFALIRWALPLLEGRILASRLGTIAFIAICALIAPYIGRGLEYGAEGWLWALTGLLARRLSDGAGGRDSGSSDLLIASALFAGLVYFIVEADAHHVDGAALVVLGGLIVALVAVLLNFRRRDLPHPPPEPLAAILRFGGRWSLELYAAHLILLEVWTLVR